MVEKRYEINELKQLRKSGISILLAFSDQQGWGLILKMSAFPELLLQPIDLPLFNLKLYYAKYFKIPNQAFLYSVVSDQNESSTESND